MLSERRRQGHPWLWAGMLVVGCGSPASSSGREQAQVAGALEAYGVEWNAAERGSAELGWQAPPADCPHFYRLRASYDPGLRFEDDSSSGLVMGRHPRQQPDHQPQAGPIPPEGIVPIRLFYKGVGAERVGSLRDAYLTRTLLGPAAPTSACMPRTWDPIDDAMALGWPRLTGRLSAVGETWRGLRVDGKCNRSACVDPQTGGGGAANHHRSCVSSPWQERLAGLYTHEGELYAWLHSRWSDGHPPGQGIHSERYTLISVEHGRPVWSQTTIDHRFAQPVADGGLAPVVRTWTLEAADQCPGSLAAAGWSRPSELVDLQTELSMRLNPSTPPASLSRE